MWLFIGFAVAIVSSLYYYGCKQIAREEQMRAELAVGNSKCTICRHRLSSLVTHKLLCGHEMHHECYVVSRKYYKKCPICGQKFPEFGDTGSTCTVCCQTISEREIIHLDCQHPLHRKCLRQLRATNNRSCPICRHAIQ